MNSKVGLVGVFLLICKFSLVCFWSCLLALLFEGLANSVNCGGDYSAILQESFYALMSASSKEPRFQLGKGSNALVSSGASVASSPSANQPPFCNGNGKFVSGVNEIGSCASSCPVNYEKHFFIEILDGEEVEFCCCGECS